MQSYFYRPVFSKVLAVGTAGVCLFGLVAVLLQDGIGAAIRTLPWLLLVAGAGWMTFWRPSVLVDDAGVRMVNVSRTIELPWPSIQRIDTKWALALTTASGTYTAWAAPAPGRMSARRLSRQEGRGLPESTFVADGAIRPGDAPGSPSGDVALVVRRHWELLRDAGHLDDATLETRTPPVTWHVPQLLVGVLLVILGLVANWT